MVENLSPVGVLSKLIPKSKGPYQIIEKLNYLFFRLRKPNQTPLITHVMNMRLFWKNVLLPVVEQILEEGTIESIKPNHLGDPNLEVRDPNSEVFPP